MSLFGRIADLACNLVVVCENCGYKNRYIAGNFSNQTKFAECGNCNTLFIVNDTEVIDQIGGKK